MASLYTNENFPYPSVEVLRRLGHVVLTVQETGKASQATGDAEVMAVARTHRAAVVTLNRRHFIRLHQQSADHFGVIVCTFDPDFEALAGRIHAVIESNQPLDGKLLRVNRPRA